jgi:hypothetical protein
VEVFMNRFKKVALSLVLMAGLSACQGGSHNNAQQPIVGPYYNQNCIPGQPGCALTQNVWTPGINNHFTGALRISNPAKAQYLIQELTRGTLCLGNGWKFWERVPCAQGNTGLLDIVLQPGGGALVSLDFGGRMYGPNYYPSGVTVVGTAFPGVPQQQPVIQPGQPNQPNQPVAGNALVFSYGNNWEFQIITQVPLFNAAIQPGVTIQATVLFRSWNESYPGPLGSATLIRPVF